MSLLNFKQQCESHTGLVFGPTGTPSQYDLTQYLRDGAIDVITTIIKLDPSKRMLFAKKQLMYNDTDDFPINSGEVIRVLRADGTAAANLYPASPIEIGDKYLASDPTSLSYRSKLNAGWYLEGKNLKLIPAASGVLVDSGWAYYIDWDEYQVEYDDFSIGSTTHEIQTNVVAEESNNTFTYKDASGSTTGHLFRKGNRVKLLSFTDDENNDGDTSDGGEVAEDSLLNGVVGYIDEESLDGGAGTFLITNLEVSYDAYDGIVEQVTPTFPKRYERLVVLFASVRALNSDLAQFRVTSIFDMPSVVLPSEPFPEAPGMPSAEDIGAVAEYDFGEYEAPGFSVTWPQDEVPEFFPPQIQTPTVGDDSLVDTGTEGMDQIWETLKDYIEVEEDEEIGMLQINKIRSITTGYAETLKGRMSSWNTLFEPWKLRLDTYVKEFNANVSYLTKHVDAKSAAVLTTADQAVKTYAANVQEYASQVQGYVQQVQSCISAFGAELNRMDADYKWKTQRMLELKEEYNKAFALMMPKEQMQREERPRRRRRRRRR